MSLIKNLNIFAVAACCIFFYSCKEKKEQAQDPYFLKEKWTTKTLRYTFLRNSPRAVIELVYPGVNDIESRTLPIFESSETFTYNEKGDQVKYDLFEGGEKYNTVIKYTDSGYSAVIQDHSGRDLEERLKTDFQRVGKNEYRQTEWLFRMGRKTQLVTYSANGDTVKKEELRTDTLGSKTLETKITFVSIYDDQRPLKQTWATNSAGTSTEVSSVFFYSPKRHLDSIVSVFANSKSKKCFVNNNMGEPVEEYTVEKGDTTYHYLRTYKYDRTGNWIRMLEHRLPDRYWPIPGVPAKDPYTLYVREIFYLNSPTTSKK